VNRRPECEALRDDLAAYALGALAGDELTALEAHLGGCEHCQARLRWLTPAVDVLPAAVEQRSPPPSLRENLMSTVRAEAAQSTVAGPEPARTEEPARESWWAGLRGLMLRPATGMAAVILLVAGIGVGYALRGSDPVETGPTLVKAEPLDDSVPVSATLEREGDSATLHVHELPPIDDDEVYEVWVQRAGVMEPRNTFVLSMNGTAEAAVPGPLEGGEAVLVTREPRGGSPQPTTDPLLSAPL
jgi:anti-sigma-K factor RskA